MQLENFIFIQKLKNVNKNIPGNLFLYVYCIKCYYFSEKR